MEVCTVTLTEHLSDLETMESLENAERFAKALQDAVDFMPDDYSPFDTHALAVLHKKSQQAVSALRKRLGLTAEVG